MLYKRHVKFTKCASTTSTQVLYVILEVLTIANVTELFGVDAVSLRRCVPRRFGGLFCLHFQPKYYTSAIGGCSE